MKARTEEDKIILNCDSVSESELLGEIIAKGIAVKEVKADRISSIGFDNHDNKPVLVVTIGSK